jgi:hypothetical protein
MIANAQHSAEDRFQGRKFPQIWMAALFALALGLAATEANAQQVMGWLEVKPGQGRNMVQITGHALALEKAEGVDFALTVRRKAAGGQSESRQAGRISLGAGETKVLSSTALNVETGGNLTVELKLLQHGQEVFSTVMSAKPAPEGQTL